MSIKSLTGALVGEIRNATALKGLNDRKDIASLVLSNESMSSQSVEAAKVALSGLNETVTNAIDMILTREGADVMLTPAQRNAATRIASLAIDPAAGMAAIGSGKPLDAANGTILSPQDMGVQDALDGSVLTTESFDGQSINNAMFFSIAYNLLAARQDEFGETFQPTITIDPTMSGVSITTEVTSLYNDFVRTTDGASSKNKFNKVTLAKAIFQNNLLNADRNRLVPVYRPAAAGAPGNAASFVAPLTSVDNATGVPITTAPLVMGSEIDILGISQTDAMLAKGSMDAYDTLDRTVNLTSVIFSLTQTTPPPAGAAAGTAATVVTEYFRVPVGMLPGSNFTYTAQGHEKDLSLAFDNSTIAFVTGVTTTWDGTPSVILGSLPANHTVTMRLKLNGDGNTQNGDIAVYVASLGVVSISDAAGNALTATSPAYTTIDTEFQTLTAEGYDIEAYLTNSNLRKQGQLVTIDKYTQGYTVPVRTGISVVMPINSTSDDDSRLVGQIQTTGYRMSLDTVSSVVSYTDNLKAMTANGVNSNVEMMGIGRHHVDPYFSENTLDMATLVDSTNSSERSIDIREALLSQIRDEVYRAYIASNYNVAHSLLKGNNGPGKNGSVGVIVGTSSRVKNYLTTDSNIIDLGSGFIAKIVDTPSTLVGDSMYITFSDHASGTRNTTVDPISFGQCFWAPTITTDVATTSNGATTRKFMSMPRYLNVVNLPIMIRLNIVNFAGVLGKVAAFRHTV